MLCAYHRLQPVHRVHDDPARPGSGDGRSFGWLDMIATTVLLSKETVEERLNRVFSPHQNGYGSWVYLNFSLSLSSEVLADIYE